MRGILRSKRLFFKHLLALFGAFLETRCSFPLFLLLKTQKNGKTMPICSARAKRAHNVLSSNSALILSPLKTTGPVTEPSSAGNPNKNVLSSLSRHFAGLLMTQRRLKEALYRERSIDPINMARYNGRECRYLGSLSTGGNYRLSHLSLCCHPPLPSNSLIVYR